MGMILILFVLALSTSMASSCSNLLVRLKNFPNCNKTPTDPETNTGKNEEPEPSASPNSIPSAPGSAVAQAPKLSKPPATSQEPEKSETPPKVETIVIPLKLVEHMEKDEIQVSFQIKANLNFQGVGIQVKRKGLEVPATCGGTADVGYACYFNIKEEGRHDVLVVARDKKQNLVGKGTAYQYSTKITPIEGNALITKPRESSMLETDKEATVEWNEIPKRRFFIVQVAGEHFDKDKTPDILEENLTKLQCSVRLTLNRMTYKIRVAGIDENDRVVGWGEVKVLTPF